MAYILHIDTSGEKGLVALAMDGVLKAREETMTARDHASSINIMIDRVVKQAGVELSQVDALAVVGGPGSYTGLRIGLATAKALCYVLEKPLMLHNKLMLLALQYTVGKKENDYSSFASILPARHEEYFFAQYTGTGEALVNPTHILSAELVELLAGDIGKMLLTGIAADGAEYINALDGVEYRENEAIDLGYWCLKGREDFDCHRFVNVASTEPFYLKQVYTHKP
jgi:tRNA threonylcarbamoyladenosine biosynthesis protein TsaB